MNVTKILMNVRATASIKKVPMYVAVNLAMFSRIDFTVKVGTTILVTFCR